MAGGVSLGQLTDQLKQIKAQQTNVTQAISANEQEAQNIQNQVTQTTADEEQQSQLYTIVTDNETRDVAAAGENHKKTLENLTAQRGKLQKPTAPASDATQEEKDKYQRDLDEYNRASAVLDDEFKAENKRYEEEIKKIKEEAKNAKDEAQAKIEECQIKLRELSKDKEANKAEIDRLLQEEQAALDAQLKAEKEIEDAKQAEKDEKARLKDEKSGGIDGNTETDRKAEKSDAKADKKALKAAKKGVKGMDGVSDVQMDKKTGTVTYTDAEGNKHTVTVSGSGRGDAAAYSIADTSGHGNELDTYIFDMGFSDGKMTVSDETGHIKKDGAKTTITSKNNGDGSTTTSESVAGLTTKSTVKGADGSEKSASVLKMNALGADMTTTTVTKNGEATTSTVTKGSDGRTTNTITNFDGTKTTVESGVGQPTVTTNYGSDGKRETVTTQDGNTTKQIVYTDGKATTESTITTGADGRPTSSVVSDLDANGNATRTVTTEFDADGNRKGTIKVGDYEQSFTAGKGDDDDQAFTTTNVQFNETIDGVLQRMGYNKKTMKAEDYKAVKDAFIAANKTRGTGNKKYFLAGQQVKVPLNIDSFTPSKSSTDPVDGKAEEAKWKSWHDAQVAKAEAARKAAEAARAAAQGSGRRKTLEEEMTSRGYYKVEGSRDVYMKDGKYYIPAINHGGGFSNAVEISTNDAFNRGVNLMSSLNARPHVQGGTATNFTLPSGCTLGQGMADKGYWYDSNSGTYYKATNPGKHYRATQLLNSVTVTEISSNEYERLRNQPQFRQGR